MYMVGEGFFFVVVVVNFFCPLHSCRKSHGHLGCKLRTHTGREKKTPIKHRKILYLEPTKSKTALQLVPCCGRKKVTTNEKTDAFFSTQLVLLFFCSLFFFSQKYTKIYI